MGNHGIAIEISLEIWSYPSSGVDRAANGVTALLFSFNMAEFGLFI